MKGLSCGLVISVLTAIIILNPAGIDAQDTNRYSVRMAESIMKWRPLGYGGWDYVTGTVMRGFEELWRVTGDNRYYSYIKTTVDIAVKEDGSIGSYNISEYNIDEIKEGCQLLLLYKQTGQEKYRKAADLLRLQLEDHPRTNSGGFWHKQRYPWQMWLDALYMGSPFYAEYSRLFGYTDDLDDVVHQVTEVAYRTYDPEAKLFYHGWDESNEQSWADSVTGTNASFWGRAIGWYAMAIVDVLDHLPTDHPGRDTIIPIFNRMAEGIALYQDPDEKVWWQVTDQVGRDSNYLESSSSCMFVYALAKGVRLGYLDPSYKDVALSGYEGILDNFIEPQEDGTIHLTQTCLTAGLGNGRDGDYAYYTMGTYIVSNDGKALGPFILASIEIEMMDSIYPPGNLLADTLLFRGPVLSWFDNSGKETGFLLERKEKEGDQDGFSIVADLPAGTISFTDTTVESNTGYIYRIRAYNATDTSMSSNPVTLTTLYKTGQPMPADNPVPDDGSDMVNIDQVLSWESGVFASSHDIYFGTENPPPFIGNYQESTYSPPEMESGTVYFWRVDEVNEKGTTEGPVWSFTTDSTPAAGYRELPSACEADLFIHPNPANDHIRLSIPGNSPATDLLIHDPSGRLVKRVRIKAETSTGYPVLITTGDLDEGIYQLSLHPVDRTSGKGRHYSGRVIIVR